MLDLLNNASTIVYIWSIYGKLLSLIEILFFAGAIIVGILLLICLVTTLEENFDYFLNKIKGFPIKSILSIWVIIAVISFLLPEKKYLPYIFSASPVAKSIINSYEDGKLKKVDNLIDKSLDKALKYLDENLSK